MAIDTQQQDWWDESWQWMTSYFSTRAQDRWWRTRQERSRWASQIWGQENPTVPDQMRLLRFEIDAAGDKYMTSLRASGVTEPVMGLDQQLDTIRREHDEHSKRLIAAIMRPLRHRVDAGTVLRTATMMTALYVLSPNARETVGAYRDDMREAAKQRIERKTLRKRAKAEGKALVRNREIDKQNLVITRNNEAQGRSTPQEGAQAHLDRVSADDYLGRKWRRRYERIQYRERGMREMFTEQSAGMTEVALLENAARRMRMPGADQQAIMKSYQRLVSKVYEQAEQDGLRREDVAQAARTVLGMRMRDDPRVATLVAELSHGAASPAPARKEYIEGSDVPIDVWRGQFHDTSGRPVDFTRADVPGDSSTIQGAFSLRPMQSTGEHHAQIARTMAITLTDSISTGNTKKFNEDLGAYLIGYIAATRDFDGEGLSAAMQERLHQSRTMFASMVCDGIPPADREQVYDEAFVDAIQMVQAGNPEFAAQWSETYGEQWQDFMRMAVSDPEGAYEQWRKGTGGRGSRGHPDDEREREQGEHESSFGG